MKYYNQYNYKHIPYPSAELPSATVSSGGCGVVCASIVIEALEGQAFPLDKMAEYSISKGGRVNGGTDMLTLGKSIARDFGLKFTTTSDINELLEHLHKGLAIINVSGNRPGYTGIFSNGGHFIVGIGADEDNITIWDPGYYTGKFGKEGRYGKVEADYPNIYVSPEILDLDCETRNPKYYLFSKTGDDENMLLVKEIMQRTGKTEEEVVQALSVVVELANIKEDTWEKQGVEKLKSLGVINSDHDAREPVGFGAFGLMLDRFKKDYIKD